MRNELRIRKSKRIRDEIYRLQELSIQDPNFEEVMKRINYLNEVKVKIKTDPEIEVESKPYGGHSKKAIIQLNEIGNQIAEFGSIKEAAIANRINPHLVTYYLRTKCGPSKIGKPKKFYFKYK